MSLILTACLICGAALAVSSYCVWDSQRLMREAVLSRKVWEECQQ